MTIRILLVEDDQDIGARLKEGLASFGFVVEHVEDGEHALSFALQEEFDAIVLDLGLPGLSGIEVLRRLRRTGAATPVLILTARSSASTPIVCSNGCATLARRARWAC